MVIKSGLSSAGLLGCTQFNGRLVFFNGVDPNFVYNGSTVADMGEYVEDLKASAYTWISSSSISLVPTVGRTDYPVGRKIRVTFETAGTIEATIDTSNIVGGTLTLTVTGTPFPASTEDITSVEYFASPPPFSFIWTANDILWGLSGGVSRPRVYRGRKA